MHAFSLLKCLQFTGIAESYESIACMSKNKIINWSVNGRSVYVMSAIFSFISMNIYQGTSNLAELV